MTYAERTQAQPQPGTPADTARSGTVALLPPRRSAAAPAQLGRSPLEADAIAVWIFEIPLFHAVVSNNRLLHINELGARECKPPSISDPQKVLPFAKFALEAHALRYLERCDDAPLDLLAGFASSFAGSPILPPGLIEVGNKSVALDGRARRSFRKGCSCPSDLVNDSPWLHRSCNIMILSWVIKDCLPFIVARVDGFQVPGQVVEKIRTGKMRNTRKRD